MVVDYTLQKRMNTKMNATTRSKILKSLEELHRKVDELSTYLDGAEISLSDDDIERIKKAKKEDEDEKIDPHLDYRSNHRLIHSLQNNKNCLLNSFFFHNQDALRK